MVSSTNYSTRNVLIANNNFIGSYADNPDGVGDERYNVSKNNITANGGSLVGITGYGYTNVAVPYTINLDLPQSAYSVSINNNRRGSTATGNFSKFIVNYMGGSQAYP